jgi:hypothetical protein
MMHAGRGVHSSFFALSLATSLALAALLPAAAWAQVSPGPLSQAHASIDSPTQCFKCHVTGGSKNGLDERCLACHTEIAWMRTQQRGTHPKVKEKECRSCHPDHGGRTFQLVVFDEGAPEKFDHRRSGFVLEGKHGTVKCRDCHKPAFQKSAATALIQKKDHAASWLGLETACQNCHEDVHRGQLGKQCQNCHGQEKFKPAGGFDHAKSDFPLTGAHVKVECLKCHAAPQFVKLHDAKGQPLPEWKPLAHGDCVSCHKDPHAGRFPGACAKCHNTENFKVINKGGFNHDLTKYPLKGKHAAVACAKCHDPKLGAAGQKPKFALCTDCHKDAHNGTATLAGKVVDCASCHSVEGFDQPTYTAAMHARSAYPLVGKHASADCSRCHVKKPAESPAAKALGTARVSIRPKYANCTTCHGDPHKGRFELTGARPKKKGCLTCHSMDGFHPSIYDGIMHADCVFPLHGAHMATPCQACHEELKGEPAKATLVANLAQMRPLWFDNPRRVCVDCHASPHGVQFSQRKDKGACQVCHGDESFVPASKFDHDRDSAFKLEGAHAKTPCASCHVSQKNAAGKTVVIYRPTPKRCESCHATGVPDTLSTGRKAGSH